MFDRSRPRPAHRPSLLALFCLVQFAVSQALSPAIASTPGGSPENSASRPGRLMAMAPATPGVTSTPWLTIQDAVQNGQISLSVTGDGVSTSHIRLALTNKTSNPVVVFIPANQILHPGTKKIQKMLVVKNSAVKLLPGVATEVELRTVCVSGKSVPPPPSAAESFTAGPYEDEKMWRQFSGIIAAADELDKQGKFSGIRSENWRKQVAQLAIWRVIGLSSSNPDDSVTPESIEASLVSEAGEMVKKNPTLLQSLGEGYSLSGDKLVVSEKRKKMLDDQLVNPLFDAIDLTLNRSNAPDLKNVAPLPAATAWETFINAGERAYNNGEFMEASEVLEAAVAEAEKFGETDPRLSRSLLSKGMCFMDFGNYEGAESDFMRSLGLREKVSGKSSIEVAEVDESLGLLKQRLQNFDGAQKFLQNGLDIVDKAANAGSKLITTSLDNLGRNFCLKGQGDQAEPLLKRALAIAMLQGSQDGAKSLTSNNPDVAEIETNLGTAYVLMGRFAEAQKLYEKALSVDSIALGSDHPFVAQILDGIADVYSKQNQPQTAEPYKQKAKDIRDKSLGKNQQIASLPLTYDALTRVQLYSNGAKDISTTMDKFVLAGETLKVPSLDKVRINRPIKDKWAIVIGVSRFQDSTINLKYASKDAQDFANYLTKEANFSPDHVHVLLNEQATRENIMAEIGDTNGFLPRVAGPDDLVVIYISSHGSPSKIDENGVNYLVAYNTDKNHLYATGIPIGDMTHMIKDRVHAERVVVVLDACHSGSANVAKGLFRVANFDADAIAQGSGQLVICSSKPDEVSWESKRYQNGVFTHYLLEGLRQGLQPAKLGDAISYMQDKVREEVQMDRSGEMQQPQLKSSWQGDALILAVPPTERRVGLSQAEVLGDSQTKPTGQVQAAKGLSGQAAKPAHPVKSAASAKHN